MIKTAMILGAGFGRRLLPLTNLRPKPMFPVLNKTMLDWWAEALVSAGVRRAVINVHHQAGLMIEHLQIMQGFFRDRLEILISPEDRLLGTGGGLKKAEALLGKNEFLVVNADIFTDFELVKISLKHLANPGRLATLGLLEGRPRANVSVGEERRILAFREPEKVPGETGRQTYSGVMVLSPAIFNLLPDGESDIIDVLTDAMAQGGEVAGWTYDPAIWSDMGEIADYWNLNRNLAAGRTIINSADPIAGTLAGWNVLGAGATVEEGAIAENCVIWPGVSVAQGAIVTNAVIASPVPPQTRVNGGCFCAPDET